VTEKDVDNVQKDLARVNIQDSELGKLQQKQRAAVQRAIVRQDSNSAVRSPSTTRSGKDRAYSPETSQPRRSRGAYDDDLQDLDFSAGGNGRGLQAPLRPSAPDDRVDYARRGSLSDFSDYESSDDEYTRRDSRRASGSKPRSQSRSGWDTGSRSASRARAYAGLSDDDAPAPSASRKRPDPEDPFADPFAD
jgi:LAS seventeen-binding protein 5